VSTLFPRCSPHGQTYRAEERQDRRDLVADLLAVRLYGRRFTIEEAFGDLKVLRYGLGLSATHIGHPFSPGSPPVDRGERDGPAHAPRGGR